MVRRRALSENVWMQLWCSSVVGRMEHFHLHHDQGVKNAESPKDKREDAPTQTGIVIFSPPKAVDIGRPPRVEEFSKCAKKLRAVFGVGSS
jgi:hypothetical protein